MYGREALLPTDKINNEGETNEQVNIMNRKFQLIKLEQKRVEVLERIEKKQGQMKQRHDKKIRRIIKFEKGQKVLLKDAAKDKQWSHKLRMKWKGPYIVNKVLGNGTYKLEELDGRILKNPYNIKLLKEYREWN